MLIGLGLAGTAVGGAGAKTIFHAISTGVAATNTSIDKNYFYEKALPALVSQMNADRKEVLSIIVQRLAGCKDGKDGSYSWFEAVHDLTDYYSASTLLGAITSISKDAGKRQTVSEEEIKTAALHFTPSEDTDDKAYLRNKFDNKEDQAIMTCWKQVNPALFRPDADSKLPKSKCAGGTLSPMRLINAAECAEDQPKVRKCIETLERLSRQPTER